MNPTKALLTLAVVAGGGFGIYKLTQTPAPVSPAPVVQQDPEPTPEAPPTPTSNKRMANASWTVNPEAVPREDRLKLPDGTWVLALNGVKNAGPMDWPRDVPWAPIKEVITDPRGRQWFVHEDGSQSTTYMTWRQDLGRMDAVTMVANPKEPMPVFNERGPTRPDPDVRR